MSKMSEQDLLNQMELPIRAIPAGPTQEEVGQVVRIIRPEPEPEPHDEPYASEFCPNCGSRNWEPMAHPGVDAVSECYDCGDLFNVEEDE